MFCCCPAFNFTMEIFIKDVERTENGEKQNTEIIIIIKSFQRTKIENVSKCTRCQFKCKR